jgi:HSP20 family protein
MTLVRWNQFRDLMNLQQQMQQQMNPQRQMTPGVEDSYGTWAPVVDIIEQGDDLVICAELPGLEQDDVDISIENNTLVLRGERKRKTEFEERDAHRLERTFGVFTRSFTLPKTVDSDRISASYKNGVLELTLPKVEQAKLRKIRSSRNTVECRSRRIVTALAKPSAGAVRRAFQTRKHLEAPEFGSLGAAIAPRNTGILPDVGGPGPRRAQVPGRLPGRRQRHGLRGNQRSRSAEYA